MEIILKQDVNKLGYKDEIVKVKDGYANNYLIPQGYAVVATSSNKKILAQQIRKEAEKTEEYLYLHHVIRKIERIGDRCNNIAEETVFFLDAKVLKHSK